MTQEVRKFDAEIGKVLQLMIHSLYTNKDIFLRELISNSSDACDKLRYLSIQDDKFLDSELHIDVKLEKNSISISDNGIGMNKDDMVENLGKIANSGTQKFVESLSDKNMQLIGQFGVGFYSSFMVAQKVTVYSKKYNEEQGYIWESDGLGEYSISEAKDSEFRGTKITLEIRPEDYEYLEKYKLHHIIKTYSDHITFPINLIDQDGNSEKVNNASLIWNKNKSEVTEEQYNEFYTYVAHSPDKPMLTLHNKSEGGVEYTNLLFIPTNKPFDLFHPDRKGRVKLYVKKVFITEDVPNLIPPYLRFLRGIIDSEDLPLNISRETLQHNNVILKIRKSIIKKVTQALKQKASTDKQVFEKFWTTFGEVFKEGLCEGSFEEKIDLLEVCHFYSLNSQDQLINLDQYIENMKDQQNQIFFISGDSLSNLKESPQLEGFKQRGIDVLLLPDHVDDFWVNVITTYKNRELVSVAKTNIDLDSIVKTQESSDQTENLGLIKLFKDYLKDRVKDVVVSNKLVDSPASLSVPEGAMNIRMEKYLIEQKQLNKKTPKILEINPKHKLLVALEKNLEKNDQKTSNLIEVIFSQACLVAGEEIENPNNFVKTVNELIEAA